MKNMKTLRIFREFKKKEEEKKNEWVCHEKLQIRALRKPGGNTLRSPKSRQLLPPGLPPGRPMGI